MLIATLFEGVKWINSATDGRISLSKNQISALKSLYSDFVNDVLGLSSEASENTRAGAEGGEDISTNLLDLLVELRSDAKENKDYAGADRIRNTLSNMGISIKDGKDGSNWSHE
jgi:cysteinyl-tRNA synthetase